MNKITNCSILILLVLMFTACGESPNGRKQVTLIPEGKLQAMGNNSFQELKHVNGHGGKCNMPTFEKAELIEKIRVLNCLYQISELVVDGTNEFEITMQAIVDLVPQAFEYPEKVAAAVLLGETRYQSLGFKSFESSAQKSIIVNDEVRGRLEIGCIENGSFALSAKGDCTIEENNLLEAVAKKVAYIIDRKETYDKRKTLEQQLRHADRLATIGQLAAGIAHELNNPLGDILGFAQLAANHPDLDESVYQDLVKIVKSTLFAREIIKKVLYFGRQTHPKEAQTDLNKLIGEWIDFFKTRCDKSGIEVVVETDEGLPTVNGDPAQLNQVFVNVVVNAIQAMPDGGTLIIKTLFQNGWVSILVADTGQGIEEENLEKIFLPFFTTKEVDEGTGLGLSVVYGIVNEHGGYVEVDSKKGQGSTFKIKFPI
jgi:two-component system NtrC family sensor kinase